MRQNLKRKFSIFFLFGIFNLIVLPAFADQVILEQLSQGDTADLQIELPKDLEPGYHQMIVEVLEGDGVVSSKVALFCKTFEGEIKLDNLCGDIPSLLTEDQLTPISVRSELPAYEGALEQKKTTSSVIAAFAIMGAVGAAASQNNKDGQDGEGSDESQGELASVAGASLARRKGQGPGDRARYTKGRAFKSFDDIAPELAMAFDLFSALLTRIMQDARYLRAIFGSYAWITPLIAVLFVIEGLSQYNAAAMPFLPATMIAIMAVGIFDAWAGFYASLAYVLTVAAAGNLDSRDAVFTVLGTSLIFFAPALLASKIRPLQRSVRDGKSAWERVTDYALASLLCGWAVSKIVAVIPILGHKQFVLSYHATEIGIIAGVLIIVRMLIEELAWYSYPERLNHITIDTTDISLIEKVRGIIFRTVIFYLLAQPFVGRSAALMIGTVLYLLPQLFDLNADRLPKFGWIAKILPNGAMRLTIMAILGAFLAKFLQGAINSPREFIIVSFVLLSIPGVLLSLLQVMANERETTFSESDRLKWLYRTGGVAIFFVIIFIVRGFDFTSFAG